MSKSQTSIPAVSQPSSPRLPSISEVRNRMTGPTNARHPATVARLDSSAYGGQVSRPCRTSRLTPQRIAAPIRSAFVIAEPEGEGEELDWVERAPGTHGGSLARDS